MWIKSNGLTVLILIALHMLLHHVVADSRTTATIMQIIISLMTMGGKEVVRAGASTVKQWVSKWAIQQVLNWGHTTRRGHGHGEPKNGQTSQVRTKEPAKEGQSSMQDCPVGCEQSGESELAVGQPDNGERESMASGTVDRDGVESYMDYEGARPQGGTPKVVPMSHQSKGTTDLSHVTGHDWSGIFTYEGRRTNKYRSNPKRTKQYGKERYHVHEGNDTAATSPNKDGSPQ